MSTTAARAEITPEFDSPSNLSIKKRCLKRIIVASSNKGDVVLDPFLGSGTTAVIAKGLGRKWVGIEKNKEYLCMAKRRLLY